MDISVAFRNISNVFSKELFFLTSYTDLVIEGASYYDNGFYLSKTYDNDKDLYSTGKLMNIIKAVKSFKDIRVSVSASYDDAMVMNFFNSAKDEEIVPSIQRTFRRYGIDGFGFEIDARNKREDVLESQVEKIVQAFRNTYKKIESKILFLAVNRPNKKIKKIINSLPEGTFLEINDNHFDNKYIYIFSATDTTESRYNFSVDASGDCNEYYTRADLESLGYILYNNNFKEPVSYRKAYPGYKKKLDLKDILINYLVLKKGSIDKCIIEKIEKFTSKATTQANNLKAVGTLPVKMLQYFQYQVSAELMSIAQDLEPDKRVLLKRVLMKSEIDVLSEWWIYREFYAFIKDRCSQVLEIDKKEVNQSDQNSSSPPNEVTLAHLEVQLYSEIQKLAEKLIEYWGLNLSTKKQLLKIFNYFNDTFFNLINYGNPEISKYVNDKLVTTTVLLKEVFTEGFYRTQYKRFDKHKNIFALRRRIIHKKYYLSEENEEYLKYKQYLGAINREKINKENINVYKDTLKNMMFSISRIRKCSSYLENDIMEYLDYDRDLKLLYEDKGAFESVRQKIKFPDVSQVSRFEESLETEIEKLYSPLIDVLNIATYRIPKYLNLKMTERVESDTVPYIISLELGKLLEVVNVIQNGNKGVLIDVQDEIFDSMLQIGNYYIPGKFLSKCNDIFKSRLK
ncbi:hypothetical protein BB560_006077 [Smittium megazygosporum]|uniref:Uncharacterized protein n=1 Tax=Smittium megazygosporum TaxID=133381 RepID=A0A2T9YIJ2_9FUNG|nr:hypothetical protein BB560_006077 [Smittium megazygosporum]